MNLIAEIDENKLIVFVEALSPREMDVLISLAADGQTNTAIGEELFISERTVRTHLVHIMEKLGASTRTQVVLTAQRLGLLETPDTITPTARAMLAFLRAYPEEYRELIDGNYLSMYEFSCLAANCEINGRRDAAANMKKVQP